MLVTIEQKKHEVNWEHKDLFFVDVLEVSIGFIRVSEIVI